jgi:O-antigen/teichoic acid export membrane protein
LLGRKFLSAGAGTVFAQIVNLACIPILARLYEPAAFGVWALVQALALVVGGLSTFRYDLAIVVEPDQNKAQRLFFVTGMLAVCVSLITILVIAAGQHFFFGDSDAISGGVLLLLGAWVLMLAAAQLLQSWLMRDEAFLEISLAQIGNVVVTNAVQLGAYAIGGAAWLVGGSVVGQFAALAILLFALQKSPKTPEWRALDWSRSSLDVLRSHSRFPKFSLPFSILSLIRERAPLFVLGMYATPAQVGLFSQIWRLANVPVGLTSSAVRPVIFQRAAVTGAQHIESTIQGLLLWLAIFGAPWVVVVIFWHRELVPLVLGPTWKDAAVFVPAVALPAFLFALTNWMDRLLDVAGRQDLNLKLEAVAAFLGTGGLAIVLLMGADVELAAHAQGIGLIMSYLAFLYFAFSALRYSTKRMFMTLGMASVVLALTAGACWAINLAFDFQQSLAIVGGIITCFSIAVLLQLRSGFS